MSYSDKLAQTQQFSFSCFKKRFKTRIFTKIYKNIVVLNAFKTKTCAKTLRKYSQFYLINIKYCTVCWSFIFVQGVRVETGASCQFDVYTKCNQALKSINDNINK